MADTADRGDDRPLLLVPGYGDAIDAAVDTDTRSDSRWGRLVDALIERGYDGPIDAVDLGPIGTTVDSPAVYAETVCRDAVDMYREHGEPVNVIGHSMGGLSARWCVEQLGGDTYVDTMVTLGTPHQGSHYAWVGWLTPGGRAMIPGSSFLQELNADGPAESVDYTAVYSTTDEGFWTPVPGVHDIERGCIPDADRYPNVDTVAVEGYSHMELLTSDVVLDTYYDTLK